MTYRFDPAEFAALRERLRHPPNAVPDTGISLSKPTRGVTGYEFERQRERAIAMAEADRKARLANAIFQQVVERKVHVSRPVIDASKITIADDHPSIHEVVSTVGALTGFSRDALRSVRRDAPIVGPRFVAIMLVKILTLNSLPAIGRAFGRDHTTILHAIRKMAQVEALTLAATNGESTLLDFATAALRAYETVFPGRCYPITEAVRALDQEAA